MSKIHHFKGLSVVDGDMKIKLNMDRFSRQYQEAQYLLDGMVMDSMIEFMPMISGDFIDRTRVKSTSMQGTGFVCAAAALLNQYPGLYENETIKFEELGKESGIAFSADNGALIYSEKEDVCGTMHQVCQYPFYVVYRTASDKERQKLSVQKFLDNLGKWICREPVIINGSETRLNAFPELSQGRVIKRITRDNSYGLEPQESGIQDWLLPLSVRYENTYEVI